MASQSTAASRAELGDMTEIVNKQQRAKKVMNPQELETTQINRMKRTKGMFLDVCRARVRLKRLREPRTTSPSGLIGSGVSIVFESAQ